MKRVFAILLTVALLLSLAACGDKENDPDAGVYICTTAEMMGMQMPIEEIYEGENKLELKSGGKGTLTLEGDSYKVKWELDGTELTVTVDGEESVGSLKNGVIEIDMMGMGLGLTFVKEETDDLANKNGSLAGSIKDRLGDGAEDKAQAGAASELGLYYGTTYAYNDQIFNMTDIYNSLCSLELLEGGKAVFVLGEETMDCTWTLDGEEFVLTNQFVDSPGSLKTGVITIDFMGMGMIMTFEKDGEAAPEAPAVTTEETPEKEPEKEDKASVQSGSYQIDEFDSRKVITVNLTLPGSMWVAEVKSHTLYAYNVESLDVAHSASPRIQFELRGSMEQVDSYMKDASNLEELDSRQIGGIDMKGRSYKLWGMQWIEYYGELSDGLWMTVKISKVSVDAGSEGSDILDNVTFE